MAEPYQAQSGFEPRYGVVSNQGGRPYNEDYCAVHDYSLRRYPKYLCFMAMADGMGGHQAGDVASQVAVQMLEQLAGPKVFSDPLDFENRVEQVLWNAFSAINSRICNLGQGSPEREGMGTTLTCALVDCQNAYIGHVGDTRAYIITSSGISAVTEDHSVVGKMVADGVLTENEAMTHEKRNILTRAVGPETNVEVDILKVPMQPGEILFICTDGLYSAVTGGEIYQVLATEADLQSACVHMVDLAIARGSEDNVSAAAWRMPPEEMLAGAGSRRMAAASRRTGLRWWAVAALALLALILGFAAGWGIGAAFIGNKSGGSSKKTVQQTITGSQKSSTSTTQSSSPARTAAFKRGTTVVISMESSTEYQLRLTPGLDGTIVVKIPNGCKLKVLTEPYTDAEGNEWYSVEVIDEISAKGKKGYVISKNIKYQ